MESFKNFFTYLTGRTDKHGNPYTRIKGKKYLINPTKNITRYGSHSHPAHTRYPHLKGDPTKAVFTPWKKVFVWLPVKLRNGKKVMLKNVYTRKRIVAWTPPNINPPNGLDQTQYATWDQVVEIELMRN